MTVRRLDEPHYAAEIDIAATPETFSAALTTLDGLAGWWTPTVTRHGWIGWSAGFTGSG